MLGLLCLGRIGKAGLGRVGLMKYGLCWVGKVPRVVVSKRCHRGCHWECVPGVLREVQGGADSPQRPLWGEPAVWGRDPHLGGAPGWSFALC